MKRETFLFTRTMRDIKTGWDISREGQGKVKTTAGLMRGGRVVTPKIDQRAVDMALEKERRRYAKQMEVLEKGRKKVNAYREKLAGTIDKNRQLMELRYGLQKQYWAREDAPVPVSKKTSKRREKEVTLSY